MPNRKARSLFTLKTSLNIHEKVNRFAGLGHLYNLFFFVRVIVFSNKVAGVVGGSCTPPAQLYNDLN